jgi:cysteine desulfurase
MENSFLYLDHSATTAVDSRVIEAMLPYFSEYYGNPSSLYSVGSATRRALEAARTSVAKILGAKPTEIYFTSCGTESDNLALRGTTLALRSSGNHIITTSIEHHAVGNTCAQLEREMGLNITYLPVDRHGCVNPDDVARAITDRTILISVMYANNEVGTIEPIAEIGKIARSRKITFHTDAVQAPGLLPLNVDELNVDLLAISGHKFYAPKGIGVLYVRQGTRILPIQTGGGQERNLRAGTENTPYIVGLATALEMAEEARSSEVPRLTALRDKLKKGVLERIPDAVFTGHPDKRLASHASFVLPGVEGEAVVLRLSMVGIGVSSGSACSSGEDGPSHVLSALNYDHTVARGSLRLTFGRENVTEDVDRVLGVLPGVVASLRAMSPFYNSEGTIAVQPVRQA